MLKTVLERAEKDEEKEKLQGEIAKAEKRLIALTTLIRKLYEDYVNGILDESNYREFLQGYQKEQVELKQWLEQANEQLQGNAETYEDKLKKLRAIAATYANQPKLTAEMLNKLIDRIEITHPIKQDGEKARQEITIIYRFINTTL
jgi:DNA repair exonuclease SbcCD ATPase subunit